MIINLISAIWIFIMETSMHSKMWIWRSRRIRSLHLSDLPDVENLHFWRHWTVWMIWWKIVRLMEMFCSTVRTFSRKWTRSHCVIVLEWYFSSQIHFQRVCMTMWLTDRELPESRKNLSWMRSLSEAFVRQRFGMNSKTVWIKVRSDFPVDSSRDFVSQEHWQLSRK